MEAHRNLQKEHDSLKTSFTEAEKKFQRKLSEMKEIQQLDQQAKAHMEDSFRLSLEEKDEKINVMQMQVNLILICHSEYAGLHFSVCLCVTVSMCVIAVCPPE